MTTMNGVTNRKFIEEYVLKCDFDELLMSIADTDALRGHVFEGLYRICAAYQCLPSFTPCKLMCGNSNTALYEMKNIHDDFLLKAMKSGKGAGQSDLSFTYNDTLYLSTSKFFLHESSKSLDDYELNGLRQIAHTYQSQYKDIKFIVLTKTKSSFMTTLQNSEKKHMWANDIAAVWDCDDLRMCYQNLYRLLRISDIESTLRNAQLLERVPMKLRFHQELALQKCMQLERDHSYDPILFALIPRSGKSYLIAAHIIASIQKGKKNFLILTPIPNETILDFKTNIFHKLTEFSDVRIEHIEKGKRLTLSDTPTVVIMSKQQENGKQSATLSNSMFDVIYFDENHYGGTTESSKKIVKQYSHGTTLHIFVTATFNKPHVEWKIPTDRVIQWDLRDVKLCKDGKMTCDILPYTPHEIQQQYLHTPNICVRSAFHNESFVKQFAIDNPNGSRYGLDIDQMFELHDTSFRNEGAIQDLLKHIFGTQTQQEKCVMHGIRVHSKLHKNQLMEEFHTMLWFLPYGQNREIGRIAPLLCEQISKHAVARKYATLDLTSVKGDLKQAIVYAETKAYADGCKGLILLSGQRAAMGISLPNVAAVFLLNTERSCDAIYQKMFRSMTEKDGKTVGYVIDFNARRVLSAVLQYSSNSTSHRTQSIAERITEMVYLLDMEDIVQYRSKNEIVEAMTKLWRSSYHTRQEYIVHQLKNIRFDWSRSELREMREVFKNLQVSKQSTETISVNDDRSKLDAVKSTTKKAEHDSEIIDEEDLTAYGYEIIPSVVRFAALLTYERTECRTIQDTLRLIQSDHTMCNVFIDQCDIWWTLQQREKFMTILIKMFDKACDQMYLNDILCTIKEAMSHDFNLKDKKALLTNLNSLLKPKEVEKKRYGEVFTPLTLVEDMLSKLPQHVWSDPSLKWFDPAVGIGNFMVCIYYRLMQGLQEVFPDEDKRHAHIIDNMLYMSELNSKNVFVCKRIFGSSANIHEGDTLCFEPLHEEFGLAQFDVVVGNPPYNDASGNKGKGHTLWTQFVIKALSVWCKEGGYLCFVHPALWRQANHEMFEMLASKQILYLEIHNEKEGMKTFRCNTRYDWYVLENVPVYTTTIVNDQDRQQHTLDLCDWAFLPNCMFDEVKSLLATENDVKCDILHERSTYGSDKSHVSKVKTNVFKYPVVYSIHQRSSPVLYWSSCNDRGHYNTSKVIVRRATPVSGFLYDDTGVYGLTEWVFAMPVHDPASARRLLCVLQSNAFTNIIKATSLRNEINIAILKLFKNQWWNHEMFVT